jgi:hypothetical protein
MPPPAPGETSSLLPQNLGEYVNMGLAAGPAIVQQFLPRTRAATAVRKAARETEGAETTARQTYAEQVAQRQQTIANQERDAAAALSRAQAVAAQKTTTGHAEWLQQMDEYNTNLEGALAQRRQLVQAAEREALEANVATRQQAVEQWREEMEGYTQSLNARLLQRQARVETATREVAEANRAAEEAWTTQGTKQYQAAVEKLRTLRREEAEATRLHAQAVQEHTAAVQQAESLAQRYLPPRPTGAPAEGSVSKYYYDQFRDQHGALPIDLRPTSPIIKEVKAAAERYNAPPALHKAIADLEAAGGTMGASPLYEIMKDVGAVTRHDNYRISSQAQRLFGTLSDAMRQSAPQEAQAALGLAKQTWMQEQGAAKIADAMGRRTTSSIIREDAQGRLTLDVPTLRRLVTDSKAQMKQWLPPAEYRQLEQETRGMLSTPAMPKQAPPGPDVAPLPGLMTPMEPRPTPQTMWDLPAARRRELRPVTIEPPPQAPTQTPMVEPAYPRPVTIETPPQQPPPAELGPLPAVPWRPPPVREYPAPTEPQLRPPALGRLSAESLLPFLATLAATGRPGTAATIGLGIAGGDLLMYGLSRALLSPQGRPLLMQAIRNGGQLSPELATMIGAFAAEVAPKGATPPQEGGR